MSGCEPVPQNFLKIGTNLWIGYESLYLAQDLGYFDDKSIQLVEMPSATEVSHAFRNGALDVAALTLDESLVLMQYITDLRVILVMDVSSGADALLAKPRIDTLAKLKGKRVGVENTAVGAILLDKALEMAKLTLDDIQYQPVMANEHELAYKNGLVDAVVTFEPHKSKLIEQGANILFDSSQMPGQIIDVLVTRQSVIERDKDILKTVIASHFKALNYIKEDMTDASLSIAARLSVPSIDVVKQFKGISLPGVSENHDYLSVNAPKLSITIETLHTLMKDRLLLFRPINLSQLVNGRLLPAT